MPVPANYMSLERAKTIAASYFAKTEVAEPGLVVSVLIGNGVDGFSYEIDPAGEVLSVWSGGTCVFNDGSKLDA